MSDTYYVVGVHGAPTPETAPHGFAFSNPATDPNGWTLARNGYKLHDRGTKWYPLPAPPTEQAQPPEPAKRWGVYSGTGNVSVLTYGGTRWLDYDQAKAAADALNALDRDGRMKGMGR